ncbi:MAG: hypothetical protein ABIP49_08235, partial [Lysobacterales bacterium]
AAYHVGVERSERIAVEEASQMPLEAQAVEALEGDQLGENGETSTPIERVAVPAESDSER